ncbi:MAG: phospho-N-acetylmuramoyl-pentapeptide-transferase [Trueperaceae bacterium]|nr:phospho-N-acetylmuramoyl-pentapeptide-transferase [Trueperaceae bacterium]
MSALGSGGTIALAALVSLLATGAFVQLAHRVGWGKVVRDDGPESHRPKHGTPTMGGAAFLSVALVVALLVGPRDADGLALVALVAASALLGLGDDATALARKRASRRGDAGEVSAATGLFARWRLLGQSVIALAFAAYAVQAGHGPFGIAALDVALFAFVVVGSVNAYNFTDGLDGLAAGVAVPALLLFAGAPLAAALTGTLLGFLWYNAHPARVFMGGVGAEALGAAVAGLAILAGAVWWLPLIALLPVLEVVSVIAQVAYFRATGGKRLLKMAPFHHHLELSGWPEPRIVIRFWVVTAALVALVHRLAGGGFGP